MKVLEMLRNINERYSCPIILIGEEGFINKIAQRRRLLSRIRRRLEFQPVGQPDIVLFFRKALGADIASNPKITDLIHKHCKGDWRPVLTVALKIEKALKASGLKEIPLKLVEDIIEKEGGKNRA
jgi:hypothetical protein